MMMAHDSSPRPPGALSKETIDVLRAALIRYTSAPNANADELRAALHAVGVEARDREMLPEHLLVVLKDLWYALPGVRTTDEPTEQVRLLQRVVTMCIKEYYGD